MNHKENINKTEKLGRDMIKIYREVGPQNFRAIFFGAILGTAEVLHLDGELENFVKEPPNDNSGPVTKDILTKWMKELVNVIKAKQEFSKANRN